MCNRQHEQQHAKEVGLETEPYHIKITVEGRGIDIDVITRDPNDSVMIAGMIDYWLSFFMDVEPKVLIQP